MLTNELTQDELKILISAMQNGMIPLPDGSVPAVDRALKSFEDLASRGYLEYAERNGFHAYWITRAGHNAVPMPEVSRAGKKSRRSISPGLLNVVNAT